MINHNVYIFNSKFYTCGLLGGKIIQTIMIPFYSLTKGSLFNTSYQRFKKLQNSVNAGSVDFTKSCKSHYESTGRSEAPEINGKD